MRRPNKSNQRYPTLCHKRNIVLVECIVHKRVNKYSYGTNISFLFDNDTQHSWSEKRDNKFFFFHRIKRCRQCDMNITNHRLCICTLLGTLQHFKYRMSFITNINSAADSINFGPIRLSKRSLHYMQIRWAFKNQPIRAFSSPFMSFGWVGIKFDGLFCIFESGSSVELLHIFVLSQFVEGHVGSG